MFDSISFFQGMFLGMLIFGFFGFLAYRYSMYQDTGRDNPYEKK